jgi:N-acetylmuramoyl-L-alanine amidase
VGLPPVPRVDGALDVRVRSPEANQVVPRDSTFVFGSVGSGAATVTVNGAPVPVAPNGAFLAYLPTPPASAPRYTVVATRGAETAQRVVPVRVAQRRALPAAGRLVVDSGERGAVRPPGAARRRAGARERARAAERAGALEFAPVGASP